MAVFKMTVLSMAVFKMTVLSMAEFRKTRHIKTTIFLTADVGKIRTVTTLNRLFLIPYNRINYTKRYGPEGYAPAINQPIYN